MAMTKYCIYAADNSGSTSGDIFYNKHALKTISKFKKDVNEIIEEEKEANVKIVYLLWGSHCVHVDEDKVEKTFRKKDGGGGGTSPQTIIEWIKKEYNPATCKIKLLYIITDGEIGSSEADQCRAMNINMMYENVVFYAYNKSVNQIDLSVAASFFKKQCTVIRNNEVMNKVDIGEGFDYDSITIDNFATKKDELKSFIQLKFLTSCKSDYSNIEEMEKLKKLRSRLFYEQKKKQKDTEMDTEQKEDEDQNKEKELNKISFDKIREKNMYVEKFKLTDYYKTLYKPAVYDNKVEIEKCISTLINYLNNDKKSYAFDALKYDAAYNDSEVEQLSVVNWPEEEKIEFPDIITFDESKNIPVILLATLNLPKKIIFHSESGNRQCNRRGNQPASLAKFKSIIDCPLFLLKDKDFKANSICYFYTVDVYQQLLNSGNLKDPFSRRNFIGGIVLAPECDKYNDYIVSASFFDSKAIKYNKGLFYYVLWKICDRKKWMDKNVVEKLKSYMLRRVAETNCCIGLSSLPLDPKINTSLPAALWYCVEISSYIFKDDDQHFSKERLQVYHGVAGHINDILTLLGYPLNITFINARIDLLKHVTILKRIQKKQDKYFYMASNIFMQQQGFLINKIVHPENIQKLNYLKLNHRSKLNENVLNDKINLEDFVYFLDSEDDDTQQIICPDTLRPHFVVVDAATNQMNSFYSELLKKTKHVVIEQSNEIKIHYKPAEEINFQRIVSFFKLYIDCVKVIGHYPTLLEYQRYVLKRRNFGPNGLPMIFGSNIVQKIDTVHSLYQEVIKDITVEEFIFRSKESVNRVQRIKKESNHPFKTDKDLNEFISKEIKVLSHV